VKPFFEKGLVNAIGGCCGSSFAHIADLKATADTFKPRQLHEVDDVLRLSGLEPFNYHPADKMRDTFIYIGERCNVAGSIAYKKAIVDGNYDKAAAIALSQVWACLAACSLSTPPAKATRLLTL